MREVETTGQSLRLEQCPLFKEMSSHVPWWSHFSGGPHLQYSWEPPPLGESWGSISWTSWRSFRVSARCVNDSYWVLAGAVELPRSHHRPSSFVGSLWKPRRHRMGVEERWGSGRLTEGHSVFSF